MKTKYMTLVVGLFVLIAMQFSIRAQEELIDAEQIARAVLRAEEVTEYDGRFNFTRVVSNMTERVRGEFTLRRPEPDLPFQIVKLSINDIVIPLAAPRSTLPVNAIGSTVNFYLSVDGYGDRDSQDASIYGWFSTNLLFRGVPIDITLRPNWVRNHLEDPLPTGLSAENAAVRIGEFNGYYNRFERRFVIYTDPLVDIIGMEYVIYDIATGRIYKVGKIVAGGSIPPLPESPFNFSYLGGPTEVLFQNNSWAVFPNQKFETNVVVGGVPARVYMVRLDGAQLTVEHYGLSFTSYIDVKEVNDGGPMPLLHRQILGKEGGERSLIIQPGYRAVIVTVVGEVDPDSSSGFQIYFRKSFDIKVNNFPDGLGGVPAVQ